MTHAQLEGIAAQALNLARRDLEQGSFNFLIAYYVKGRGLKRMTDVEKTVIERLGKGWLNSGSAKDVAFDLFRLCVSLAPPDAFIFATAGNRFVPTAAFHALPKNEQQALLGSGHDCHHRAVAEGLLAIQDVFQAIAQTRELVCIRSQPVGPDGKFLDQPPSTDMFTQEGFGGRMKVY